MPDKPLTPAERAELDSYEKGTPYDAPAQNMMVNPEAMQAAGAHALNTAAMNYGPEIVGAAQHPLDALSALLGNPQMPGTKNEYVPSRDRARATLDKYSKDLPLPSGVGAAAGMIPAALVPLPGGAAKSAMGRIAQSSAVGGAYGGLQNPGSDYGVVDPVQGEKRLSGAAAGAGLGALLGTAGEGITAGATKLDRVGRDALARKAGLDPTKGQGDFYEANHPAVEAMRQKAYKDPEGLQGDFRNILVNATSNKANPSSMQSHIEAGVASRNALGVGKTVRVKPEDIRAGGPEMAAEMDRIIRTQRPPKEIPTAEFYQRPDERFSANQVQEGTSLQQTSQTPLDLPSTQVSREEIQLGLPGVRKHAAEANEQLTMPTSRTEIVGEQPNLPLGVSSTKNLPSLAAEYQGTQVQPGLRLPVKGDPISIPSVDPAYIDLPVPQAERLKEIGAAASKHGRAMNVSDPAYNPAANRAAAQAARGVRRGIEGAVPGTGEMNVGIARDIRAQQTANRAANRDPSKIFTSETLPSRATRQRLDAGGINDMQKTAQTYQVGKALGEADKRGNTTFGLVKGAAKAGLRARGAVGKAIGRMGGPGSLAELLGKARTAAPNLGTLELEQFNRSSPAGEKPLTPEEQDELDRYEGRK
jgi:hypothetical protein